MNSLEFLAINRGHGNSQTLGKCDGIQINMTNLNGITIQERGESA